jgi:cation diffusion facilitator CzcD-associated flavoprotein CzcO
MFAAKKIRLNTEVVRVEELENGAGWKVIMNDWNAGEKASVLEEIWDAVVVATGRHEFPLWPATPGLEEARKAGLAKHAKYWKLNDPRSYENKVASIFRGGLR